MFYSVQQKSIHFLACLANSDSQSKHHSNWKFPFFCYHDENNNKKNVSNEFSLIVTHLFTRVRVHAHTQTQNEQ